ncbi:DNA primase [Marine Group I thaumarchaeote]|jgi:DNA primase small subunit|uniref:DNA primase small subunit PriS n=1 Tax=Marine Group I thaumarchaeote TaxID=2511932 RepID=A0A7K4NH42_9ARCH|nr:DNA primase [Marine Group I thaumarchaeote]NWJ99979.1 DNA primase [Marine Group I thaumarchaeote]
MLENDLKFLEETFKQYYFDHFDSIHVPDRSQEREYGYKKFNSGMIRHISLKTDKDLHLMLMTNVPSDVFCSNAYYSFPNLPMAEKDWKEADLIFDIDAKDLNLSCRKDHTCIKCISCGEISLLQDVCPKCKSNKLDLLSLPCQNCISGVKKEVLNLIKILTNDLQIDDENVRISFSGNEGFHLYVANSFYNQLGSKERGDLIDYIMFRRAIPERFGFKKENPSRLLFPELDEAGWRGRVAKELFGSKSKRSKAITKIISNGYFAYQQILEEMGKHSIGIKIDPNVTVDIHRIFRLEGSLNSKSGLAKLACENIEKFNPYVEACLIDDKPVEVSANSPIEFRLKNRKFGPYTNEKVFVPKYVAVYMLCKGIASLA